eukprot:jgi/Botrbrau1/4781/Bobra.0325s0004.1
MVMVGEAALTFEGHPTRSLGLWLFKNVTNSGDLQKQIIAGNITPELALLDASVVPDIFVIQLAGFKALTSEARGTRRTRSLHAELVVDVSGSKHIKESLTRFGVTQKTQHLLVGRFDPSPADEDYIKGLVKGEQVPLEELPSLTDTSLLGKYFKIAAPEMTIGTLTDAVCCRIASRDC